MRCRKPYFFLVTQYSVCVGGISVGRVITSSEKSDVFEVAVTNLVEIMPTKICPVIIINNVFKKEKDAEHN